MNVNVGEEREEKPFLTIGGLWETRPFSLPVSESILQNRPKHQEHKATKKIFSIIKYRCHNNRTTSF
jgi:hypothetical protein